ncbi:MAG TPA: polysaccharide deacetylase family protein, partial [Bacteroidales bacterium]|nr:polysaccharide deacetylase family protein [Bacteroidales bacterium]
IYLIFSADSMFQGGEKILKTLDKYKIKGSFFFTGNFLRMEEKRDIISKIIKRGHYVGGHSDMHLLYAEWDGRRKSLVIPDSLVSDLQKNFEELSKYGVNTSDAKWFLPPFEHYNSESVEVLSRAGVQTINYTPGTATPADYTTPEMENYKTAEGLIDKLFEFEKEKGLNGAIILIHPGVSDSRPDKLYDQLGTIIKRLKGLGYSFDRL